MDLQEYRDELKLNLTGYAIESDLDDAALDSIILKAFREMQRYIRSPILMTIPYSPCIDLSKYNVNIVLGVYRTEGYASGMTGIDGGNGYTAIDPIQASQWQMLSGTGNLANFSTYMSNYASWNTMLQIRNTMSTDLAFHYDYNAQKLYINIATNVPDNITIEYVPVFKDISEVKSYFWIDNIIRLAVALAKVVVGRIRTRYGLANALWTQDGETILAEGNADLAALREHLNQNSMFIFPID